MLANVTVLSSLSLGLNDREDLYQKMSMKPNILAYT